MNWLIEEVRTALMGWVPCAHRHCGRQRVGLSHWCREHTDRIIRHGEGIDDWPRRR